MINRFALLLVLLLIATLGVAHRSDAVSGIYRISLTEGRPFVQLSQSFGVLITELPAGRSSVFIELSSIGEQQQLRILPAAISLQYELIVSGDTATQALVRHTQSEPSAVVVPYTRTNEQAAYRFTDTSVTFSLTDLPGSIAHTLSREKPVASLGAAFSITAQSNGVVDPAEVLLRSAIALPDAPSMKRVTPIYQYDFTDDSRMVRSIPLTVKIAYTETESNRSKQMYYFDKSADAWLPLSSYHDSASNTVEAKSYFPYAPVAVFETAVGTDGTASWYAYKGCLCAASRDYPKGTKLRVTRLKTGAEVVVTVNDYGPEAWTGRIIDLDKTAFERIGSLGAGLIQVNMKPYD